MNRNVFDYIQLPIKTEVRKTADKKGSNIIILLLGGAVFMIISFASTREVPGTLLAGSAERPEGPGCSES